METPKNIMDKQITSGVVGEQVGGSGDPPQKATQEARPGRAALGPAEAENIRGFAEHVVRLLCERHNGTPQDPSSPKS